MYKKNMKDYELLEGWERVSIGEHLSRWAMKYKDKTALITETGNLTYAELDEESKKVAKGFLEIGITAGDKVVLQMPNVLAYPVTLFALYKIGAIPILALHSHRENEIKSMISTSDAIAYIIPEKYQGYDFVSLAKKMKEQFSCLKYIIVDGMGGDIRLSDIKSDKGELPEVDGYDTAHFLLSGGSTGIPKLIPRTHTDYIYNVTRCVEKCNLNSDDIYLVALSGEHNFPLSCPGILGTLMTGGTVVFCKNTSPDEILDLITEYEVTVTALVPTMALMCISLFEDDDYYDLSSLRLLQVGGAMLQEAQASEIINKYPCKLNQIYGTTEGLMFMTELDDPDEIVKVCQGRPIDDATEIRIVDENGVDVPEGQYGEVICRGPYTIDGYYKSSEANKTSFNSDGFYLTGDKAMRDKENRYRFGGRVKEQINRAGEKIMPSEVEEALCEHKKISDAAVVGIKDDILGEKICACVIYKDNSDTLKYKELIDFLQSEGLASYKLPDDIKKMNEFPLTNMNKVNKVELKKMMEADCKADLG